MIRQMLAALATTAAVATAAGCGGGGTGAQVATPVDVAVSDTGYAMPDHVTGGVVAMRFHNTGTQPHEVAMGRADTGHSPAEVAAAVGTFAGRGEPPAWLHDVAGPPLLTPGADITVTRSLEPGTYVFFDGVPDTTGVPGSARGLVKAFTVEGDSGASPPTPDAVITAEKTRYVIPAISAGTRTIELRNSSGTPRGFLLTSINSGHTEADAEQWTTQIDRTGKLPATPVPFTVLGAMQTIPSGTSVYVTLGLQAGREYRLSDDESGISARFTPN